MSAPQEVALLTRGINVRVAAFFLDDQSAPEAGRYVWAYRVTIENRSAQTVQLLSRTWEITDGSGRMFRVQGDGVVGEQPVLEPGEAFEYTSARRWRRRPASWWAGIIWWRMARGRRWRNWAAASLSTWLSPRLRWTVRIRRGGCISKEGLLF